jgi:hypothetical protein
MAKMGRPEKDIDWEKFEELCHIQCTHDEIASMCHVAKSTLYERAEKHYGLDFPTVYKRFSEGGKCSLRRTQFKISNKSTPMAIWLGKQYLGQKDSYDYDKPVDPEMFNKFVQFMEGINRAQGKSEVKPEVSSGSNSDLNNAPNNISNAEKS